MANTSAAKKQARKSEARREINLARRTAIKTAIKKVLVAVEDKKNETEIRNMLSDVAAKLYRAKSKGLIHKNTAARKLSRLTKTVNKAYSEA